MKLWFHGDIFSITGGLSFFLNQFRLASRVGTLPAGGSFCSVKRNQNPLRAFPPKDLPGVRGCPCVKTRFGPLPLLWPLSLPPHQATLGSWPYGWVVSISGPTLAKRRSRRRGFCCTILLRCGKGRGLPGPLVPLYCPGGFGRGKPLPYTQQRKKFGNVQGLFAPGPRQLGTVAGQGKALEVEVYLP